MSVKNIFKFFWLMSVIVFPCAANSANFESGLLWRIEHPSGQTSVLFGTMHFVDDEVINVFELVKEYLAGASSINVEYVPKPEDVPVIEKVILKTDIHIKDRLGENDYIKFLSFIKNNNIPLDKVEYASPSYLHTLIIDPKSMTELPMDARIMAYAAEHNIELNSLENINECLKIITSQDNTYYLSEIKSIINDTHKILSYQKQSKSLYLEENLTGINNFIKTQTSNRDLAKTFFDQAITHRNQTMIKTLSNVIEKGNAFIAVGAGHLGGEEGLLNLLMQSGYKVSRIYFMT